MPSRRRSSLTAKAGSPSGIRECPRRRSTSGRLSPCCRPRSAGPSEAETGPGFGAEAATVEARVSEKGTEMVTRDAAAVEGSRTEGGDRILNTAVPFRGIDRSALRAACDSLLRGAAHYWMRSHSRCPRRQQRIGPQQQYAALPGIDLLRTKAPSRPVSSWTTGKRTDDRRNPPSPQSRPARPPIALLEADPLKVGGLRPGTWR